MSGLNKDEDIQPKTDTIEQTLPAPVQVESTGDQSKDDDKSTSETKDQSEQDQGDVKKDGQDSVDQPEVKEEPLDSNGTKVTLENRKEIDVEPTSQKLAEKTGSDLPSTVPQKQQGENVAANNSKNSTEETIKSSSELDTKSSNPNLKSEPSQHRNNVGTDKPSSYQSIPPATYLQIRALALQLPNVTSNTSSNSNGHHIDPPTLILEARTNMSTARRSFYPRVTRTLPEMQLWILALTLSFPAGIFSPFQSPPPALVVGGSMEDSVIRGYLSTITHQFARILKKPFVLSHPATVALIDSDFNYNPTVPHVGPGSSVSARRKLDDGISIARMGHDPLMGRKGKGGSGISATATWDVDGVSAALGLPGLSTQASSDIYGPGNTPAPSTSKNPLSIFSRANASPQRIQPHPQIPIPPGEEDEAEEELTAARNEITRLELQFEKASKAAQLMVDKTGSMTATLYQLNTALMDLARLDEGRLIARKAKEMDDMTTLTKGIESWAAAQTGSNLAVMGTIVPSMSYQSLNARSAIDALLRRAAAASHRYQTLIVLVQKRREAERMKRARGEIRQEDVDWILQELRDAQRTTSVLTHHLSTFTTTLKEELKEHSRNTHTDIQDALINHARNSMRAHKYILNNLVRARDGLVAIREGRSVDQSIVPPLVAPIRVEPLPSSNAGNTVSADLQTDHVSNQIVNPNDLIKNSVPQSRPNDIETANGNAQISEQVRTPSSALSSASINKDLPEAPVPTSLERVEEDSKQTEDVTPPSSSVVIEDADKPSVDMIRKSDEFVQPPPPLPAETDSPWNTNSKAVEPLSAPSFGAGGGGNISQSAFLPPPQPSSRQSSINFASNDFSSPFDSDNATNTQPNTAPASSSESQSSMMSQSAFLSSGRDMNRYANPFARMDGGGSGINGNSSNPFGGGNQTSSGNSTASTNKKPKNDVWANRSRISASDAARSLAGRF